MNNQTDYAIVDLYDLDPKLVSKLRKYLPKPIEDKK
jgi:hypothetical protein